MCRSSNKGNIDTLAELKEGKKFKERLNAGKNINTLYSHSNNQILATEDNMAVDQPQLGIYDIRLWKTDYMKWLDNKITNPTKHPDPNVHFDEEKGHFLWNKKIFYLKEYESHQSKLIKEAR